MAEKAETFDTKPGKILLSGILEMMRDERKDWGRWR
jgi:hypothetical protein